MTSTMLFAVFRTRGNAWDPSLQLEEQSEWKAHAVFMDQLEDDGFIVLGGPLEDSPDVLLIVRAATAEDILDRLLGDPWTSLNLLRVSRISRWTLRLGSLAA